MKQVEVTPELKPCPFCGGETYRHEADRDFVAAVAVGCKQCGALGPFVDEADHDGGDEALWTAAEAKWNTRIASLPVAPTGEAIERLKLLLAKATPGPWEYDGIRDPDAEYGSGPDPDRGFDNYEIYGSDGLKILGTEDAAHKEIEAEQDDDGYLNAWDRIGLANVELIVEMRNALPALLASLSTQAPASRPTGEAIEILEETLRITTHLTGNIKEALASLSTEGDKELTREETIKHMVHRFLAWKLPENFNPDGGISVKRPNYDPRVHWEPVGTNLFDAQQAEAMVRHMIEGLPNSDQAE